MSDEITKLRSWLESHGGGFELAVGRMLRADGWGVRHGGYFVDLETSKTRDLDIYAAVHEGSTEHKGVVTVALAAECKRRRDKPWVAFTSAAPDPSFAFPYAIAPGNLSQVALLYGIKEGEQTPDLLRLPSRLAHGITTGHTDSKDSSPTDAYSAVRGAVAAAAALTRRRELFAEQHAKGYGVIDLVLPTVVLDGRLYESYIAEDGAEKLEETDAIRLIMPDPLLANGTVICSVFTRTGLERSGKQLAKDARTVAKRVLPHARDLCARIYRETA